MSAGKPVNLNGRRFATKTEAKSFFRNIESQAKKSGNLPLRIVDEEQTHMLEALLNTHDDATEKIGSGLNYFFVDFVENHKDLNTSRNYKKGAVAIYIKRIDESDMDFGIPKLIDKYGKDPHRVQKAEVKLALREAIEPVRQKIREKTFEDKGEVTCPRTGITMTNFHQARVINESPSWEELTSGFVSTLGGWDEIELSVDSNNIQYGKRLSDNSVSQKWITYWNDHSDPIICARIE
ncbi:MAG: DUF3223 domain-containing protein [Bifidobacterium crudilactis]|jgi:hypothetical protein